jgi:subtilase family serine protease
MAYDDFGVTAVGGTTVTLNPSGPSYLHLISQIAWYNTTGEVGSTGGVSAIFPEPSWQQNSSANAIILGKGRATPDVSADANNTIVMITENEHQDLFRAWGTSVACPIEAGIVVELDHSLEFSGMGELGFLDPKVYSLAGAESAASSSTSGSGRQAAAGLVLPTPVALLDVTRGANAVYAAEPGYSLVTGWGSVDAYNLTMDLLPAYHVTFAESGLPPGTNWSVTLDGVRGGSAMTTMEFTGVAYANYSFAVGLISGYVATPNSGTITMDGFNVSESITFRAQAPTFLGLPTNEGYFVIGGIASAPVVVAAIAVLISRRNATPPRPEKPEPGPDAGAPPSCP